MIKNGLIGTVKVMTVREIRFPLKPGWRNEFTQSGGIMLEKNSHYLQLFNEIAGAEPDRVFGLGDRAVNFQTELLDNCVVVVSYPNGVKASLMMCLMDPFHEHYDMEIIGTEGRMTIDVKRSEICYYLFSKNVSAAVSVQPVPGKEEAMHPGTRGELLAFIDCVKRIANPEIDAAAAARITALSLAIEESFIQGSIIEVPQITSLS